eukprot:1131673-Pyramimonas_sp.AAC.1
MGSDDALGSKVILGAPCGLDRPVRIYVGHVFKRNKQGWSNLLKVSDHSMQLSFDKLHSDWINRPEQLRRKYGRKEMEDSAEMSCLVEYIYRKTLHTTPLSAADLNDSSCQAYIEGSDRHLSLELSSILADKPADVAVES